MTHAKLAVFALFAIVALAAVFVLGKPLARKIDGTDAAYRTAVILENQQQALSNQLAYQKAQATAPASVALQYILVAGLSVSLSLAAMIAWKRLYKSPLIRADTHGRFPVARDMLAEMKATNEQALTIIMASMQQATAVQIESARAMHRLADEVKITVTESRAPIAQTLPMLPPPMVAELPALMLPDNIGLADVSPQIKPYHLAYGVLSSGELLQTPLLGSYHGLRAGDTRTGKSNSIDSEIVQLHHLSKLLPLRLYAADYKRELKSTWQRSALFADGIATDANETANILESLVYGDDGILARQDLFGRVAAEHNKVIRNIGEYCKATRSRVPLSILFIDEINALLESASGKDGERVESLLKIALQTGAASGVYIQGGAQYLSAKVMGRDASKQFVARQYFGAYDDVSIRMLFGQKLTDEARELLTSDKGRGLIKTAYSPTVQAFQSLRCDEADILQAIELVAAENGVYRVVDTFNANSNAAALQSPKTPLLTDDSVTLNSTPNAAETPVPDDADNAVTEIQRAQIIALAQAGISRTKISVQLFNSNNSKEYAKVKGVLDAQVTA